MAVFSMFGSRSVLAHLVRGAIAAALLTAGFASTWAQPGVTIACIAGAVVAMRGCPMCWTIGLIEAIASRWRR
jgi:hypothetical protein